MTFPLWYLLLPYALVVLGTGLFLFFNLYHIAKFSVQSFGTTLLLGCYTVLYVAVLLTSLAALSSYVWQRTVTIGDVFPFVGGIAANSNLDL